MILRATIRPLDGVDELGAAEVGVASFALGRTELDDLTPAGWRRTHIVTVPTS